MAIIKHARSIILSLVLAMIGLAACTDTTTGPSAIDVPAPPAPFPTGRTIAYFIADRDTAGRYYSVTISNSLGGGAYYERVAPMQWHQIAAKPFLSDTWTTTEVSVSKRYSLLIHTSQDRTIKKRAFITDTSVALRFDF